MDDTDSIFLPECFRLLVRSPLGPAAGQKFPPAATQGKCMD